MKHWSKVLVDEALWNCRECPDHLKNGLTRLADIVAQQPYHRFRLSTVEQHVDEIAECTDLTELTELTWRAAQCLGFENISVFLLSQGSGEVFRTRICTNYNRAWIARYQDMRYQRIDPVLCRAREQDGSFSYAELPQSPIAEDFWKDAAAHKIGTDGLCVAINRKDGARLGVTYATRAGRKKTEELIALNRNDLEVLAHHVIDCFCDLGTQTISCDLLTEAELRFLREICTAPNYEDVMRITDSFGSNASLQASIRKKLDVQTIFQAIALAVSKRWFDDLPYFKDEVIVSHPVLDGWQMLEAEPEPAV